MSWDISAHAVDPALFRDRLVPHVRGEGNISDLIERATQVALLRHRAKRWAGATFDLERRIRKEQEKFVPLKTYRTEKPARQPSILDRILGKAPVKEFEEFEEPGPVPGMPGFDTDLDVWGRPFFNTARGVDAGLAVHERFLATVGKPLSEIDTLCREMLDQIDKRRGRLPPDTPLTVSQAMARFPPYRDAIQLDTTTLVGAAPDPEKVRADFVADWMLIQRMWAAQGSAGKIDFDAMVRDAKRDAGAPPPPAQTHDGPPHLSEVSQLLASLPFEIMEFAAALDPGWMGRGYVTATWLFDKINVDVSHVFETPAPLFADLIAEAPDVNRCLSTMLPENYALGGYVPPQKVPTLIDLLEKHKRALILAWDADTTGAPEDLDDYAADYFKILEPATYAARKGRGYVEAAEIY